MNTSHDIMGRSVFGKLNLNGVFALAGAAGPIVLIITDLTVAFSDPGYSLLRHSISSLAWAHLGWVQTIGFLALGLLLEVFVLGLFLNIHGTRCFGLGIALLICFGFGLLLIGAFHTDPAVGPHTIEGTIHSVAAKTIFWLFPAASLLIAPSLKKDPYWSPLFVYTVVAAIFALISMTYSIWLPADSGWFGLYERILVADGIIWVEIMAVWLLRSSLKIRGKTGEIQNPVI